MADVKLAVDPREVTGKKVKALRRQGILPAHLYGRDTDSLALQAPTADIISLLKTASRNAIIDLQISGEAEARAVIIRGVQRNAITDELVHVDFFQISLTEKLSADVPVVIVGEAPAVSVYEGVLLQNLDHITVEALPTDIPQSFEIDISTLEELEDALFVRDVAVPANVTVLTAPDQLVVKVSPPKLQSELEEELAAAEEAAEAEAEEGEGEEGEETGDESKEEKAGD